MVESVRERQEGFKVGINAKNPSNMDGIQYALQEALTAGLSLEETNKTRDALALEKEWASAREALRAVLSAKNPTVSALQQTWRKADAAKYPQLGIHVCWHLRHKDQDQVYVSPLGVVRVWIAR